MAAGLDLYLPQGSPRGRSASLEAALRAGVRTGRLRSGQRLPSTRALARDLGVARGTVVEAYTQLAAEGYLRAITGQGTFVAERAGGSATPSVDAARPPGPAADFRLGRPDLSAFPRSAWLSATRRALQATPDAALGPGDPRGAPELRAALAAYLGRVRGVLTTPESLVVCSGFAQGLRLVCDALVVAGEGTVGLEDPGLPDHRAIAAAAGARIVALPVDDEGARPIDAELDAVVLTPAHQCPLGATLGIERRAAFVALARERRAVIVEDDYDGEFRYDRHPVGALQGLDPARVVYAGTASKTLAPALRIGWLAIPERLLESVVEAKRRADRGTPLLEQLTLAELISSGAYDQHIRRMRLRYRRRRDALMAMLAVHAPDARLLGSAAGLHLVLRLPRGVTEHDVEEAAGPQSLAVTVLGPFWHRPDSGEQAVILGYGTPPEERWPEALRRLEAVIRSLRVDQDRRTRLDLPAGPSTA